MTTEIKSVCNHCGASAPHPSLHVTDAPIEWAALNVVCGTAFGQSSVNLHACPACLRKLAAFFPKSKLIELVACDAEVRIASESGARATRNQVVQATETMKGNLLRPTRLVVDHPERWDIVDVLIGDRSHRPQRCSESDFAASIRDQTATFETFESWGVHMDLIIIFAKYIGENPEGESFACTIYGRRPGTAADLNI